MRTCFLLLALLAPAVSAAGSLPKDLSYNDLIDYLKTGGAEARAEACKRLAQRHSKDAVDPIGAVVEKDEVWKTRKVCVEALKEIGAGAPHLSQALLQDSEKEVRLAALDALERLEPKDLPALAVKVLEADSDNEVRRRTCWLIEKRGWPPAVAAVAKLIGSDAPVPLRKSCLKALVANESELGHAALHHALTDDSSVEIRREAGAILEDRPRRSSLQPLCKALSDSDETVVRHAVDGLQRLGLRDGAACLIEASKSVRNDRLAGRMNEVAGKLK